jgi:hypothetical protein
MRITSAGNVGIGTNTPAAKLDVNVAGGMARVGGSSGNNLFQTYTSSGSVGAGIWAGGQTRFYTTGDMTLSVGATLTTAAPTGYTDALTITSAAPSVLEQYRPVKDCTLLVTQGLIILTDNIVV